MVVIVVHVVVHERAIVARHIAFLMRVFDHTELLPLFALSMSKPRALHSVRAGLVIRVQLSPIN
jgi:hypothetical protein